LLFQIDLTGARPEEVFEEFWNNREAEQELRLFAERLVYGVHGQRRELDRWISGSAEHWRIDRMAIVDRNVLRMAVHEMVTQAGTPPAVIIDEAIEVAKRFGSEESGAFINGVLDAIYQRLKAGEIARTDLDEGKK
jgi:N utilization substance protein B